MGKGLNILVIDDEQNSRELLLCLLAKYFEEEYTVSEAPSVAMAKKLINETDFDIIFSDSKMPFTSSNDLIKSKHNKKTQFVLCTALNNSEFTNSFDFPVYFLQKPIDFEDFKIICSMIKDQFRAIENTLII